MDSDLGFDWFDLNNYEPFKTMSTEDWIFQLNFRSGCYDLYVNRKEELNKLKASELLESTKPLKEAVVPHNDEYGYFLMLDYEQKARDSIESQYENTTSINCTTSLDLFEIHENSKLDKVWNACDKVSGQFFDEVDKGILSVALTSHDLNNYERFNRDNIAHVNVDLSATNKQLKDDFNQWLLERRKKLKVAKKNEFKQSDFDKWIRYAVIQYLDIFLVSKLEKIEITHSKMAKMIFPYDIDTDVDLVERVRKVTKPMAESILNCRVDSSLSLQLIQQKIIGMKTV